MCNEDANDLILTDCTFCDNSSNPSGGGIYSRRSNQTLINCIFSGNKAHGGPWPYTYPGTGAGIYAFGDTILNNCTFSDNWAHQGRAISKYSLSDLRLTNCILWDGGNEVFQRSGVKPTITYSNIQGGWEGDTNIDENPLFANPGYWADADDPNIAVEPNDPNAIWIDGDYHLKSQAGRWDAKSQSWIVDDVTSPCIDAGDPNSPIGHEPLPNGGIINMGAYGGTDQASKSYILAKVIYVDDDAVGNNDGTSWENAYTFLQDALADANSAEKPVEIRVAQGIYKPDQGVTQTLGDRTATFRLINGVTLKGGYAGAVEPNTIDIELYETILSGDLSRNYIDVNDSVDLQVTPHRYDYSWHVVTGSNTDETAVLDGFTITGGYIWVVAYNLGGPPTGGAGMLISSGSPTLIDCTFTDNVTGNAGGGLLIYDDSNPTLLNCKFTRNNAGSGGGFFSSTSNPTLIDCIFSDNFSKSIGGGMCSSYGNPKLTNCTFIRNSAPPSFGSTNKGGGIYCGKGSPVLTNCTFNDNMSDHGGAVYNDDGTSSILVGCTFISNMADHYGGAVFNGAVYNNYTDSNLMLTQCVFKQNSASQGGAMEVYCPTLLTDCTFTGNSAAWDGGAISVASAIFDNCIFTGNRAIGYKRSSGGAVHVIGGAPFETAIKFNNCTFNNNWAELGCAIYINYITHINNCILWGCEDQIRVYGAFDLSRIMFVDYSNIQGGWPGNGNIDFDPLFVNPGYWADVDDPNIVLEPNNPNAVWVDGDYHLKSQAGRWDPVSESWIVDDVTSPCIDAGDPNSPIGYEPFPNGGIINMGAYGGTEQASLSLSTIQVVPAIPP
jgi:parallel beta-helix repeat protein/predicted outer membrane repeat protein